MYNFMGHVIIQCSTLWTMSHECTVQLHRQYNVQHDGLIGEGGFP